MSVVLGNRYEVGDYISEGYHGTVYKGFDNVDGVDVAIKVTKNSALEEFENTMAVQGKHVVEILDVGNADIFDIGRLQDYMVFEYLPYKYWKLRFETEEMIIESIKQWADLLYHMGRRGYIHDDMHTDNVMVSEDGVIKLIDFGLCSASSRAMENSHFSFVLKVRNLIAKWRNNLMWGTLEDAKWQSRLDEFEMAQTWNSVFRLVERYKHDFPTTRQAIIDAR